MKLGRVALVGAGPGDPSWLTLRAAELIRTADVVAHDELISEAILAMVPARAELLAIGAPGGAAAAHGLHPELKARALRGQNVVRLEVGDPLIFGRGGEQAQQLAEAGIEFEIVPGITAAAGAAVYAGIPRGATWRRRLPLFGKTLIVARARPGTSEIGRRLRDLGAIAIELPHVEKGPTNQLSLPVNDANERDVALLSNVEAVEAWLDSGLAMPTIALGGEVAALLRAAKRPAIFSLRGACLEAVEEAREHLAGRRIFIPIAAGSRTTLSEPLSAVGATPVIVEIGAQQSFAPARWPVLVDLVVLPSSLAALALYSEAPPSILKIPAIAIGSQSAKQASRSGASEVRTAVRDTIESLVAGAVEFFVPVPHAADAPGSVVDSGDLP